MDQPIVFVCRVNAHREGWNGDICREPTTWDCGTQQVTFRSDFCAAGIDRCFHLQLFDPTDPRLVVPDRTVVDAIRQNSAFLKNQILLFAGSAFGEPNGIRQRASKDVVYGAYCVKSAEIERRLNQDVVIIRPHNGAWTLFPPNRIDKPYDQRYEDLNYIKFVPEDVARELFRGALDDAKATKWHRSSLDRLSTFTNDLDRRLVKARETFEGLPKRASVAKALSFARPQDPLPSAFADLGRLKISVAPSPAASTLPSAVVNAPSALLPDGVSPEAPTPAPLESIPSAPDVVASVQEAHVVASATVTDTLGPLPEAHSRARVEAGYGRRILTALEIASRSKSLTILTGNPGVGKSRLAALLLDDAGQERSLIVPVSSTWRGREDLLGYVNPVTGLFEPTALTSFLLAAEHAWDQGDRRRRLVVFEEFNISQPEHWLSDVLVRAEYPANARKDRTIDLGGRAISGAGEHESRVYLAPSVSFVATINNDHTVRALSPRVIDRASVIEITATVTEALARAEVAIDQATTRVIEELNSLLEPKGIAFSVRTGLSIKRCEPHLSLMGLSFLQLIDVVLANELLCKVRLMSGDPRDEQLLEHLVNWCGREDSRALTLCAERIDSWGELMRSGRDVFQA